MTEFKILPLNPGKDTFKFKCKIFVPEMEEFDSSSVDYLEVDILDDVPDWLEYHEYFDWNAPGSLLEPDTLTIPGPGTYAIEGSLYISLHTDYWGESDTDIEWEITKFERVEK